MAFSSHLPRQCPTFPETGGVWQLPSDSSGHAVLYPWKVWGSNCSGGGGGGARDPAAWVPTVRCPQRRRPFTSEPLCPRSNLLISCTRWHSAGFFQGWLWTKQGSACFSFFVVVSTYSRSFLSWAEKPGKTKNKWKWCSLVNSRVTGVLGLPSAPSLSQKFVLSESGLFPSCLWPRLEWREEM